MSPIKQQAIKAIEALPDDATLDDIMYSLYFRAHVEEGLRQLDEGKGIPLAEVKRQVKEWLSK
ncbi:MAG: hypothetical protein GX442_14555 [Candidatus Riflebacteria bacterium]|nr:hypothetical protein [Candidatus Riflebacteria bacterium]